MVLRLRARILRAASRVVWLVPAICAFALAGCDLNAPSALNAAQPRGATVAFESIDGPPPGQFRKLVADLNDEAQSRRLAVTSRESPSVYRVRGYLAAEAAKGKTRISWVWDVFDRDEHRALRISGEEFVKGRHRDAWAVADDAMLRRIARGSMDQIGTFLTAPSIVPAAAAEQTPAPAQVALIGQHDPSPEAAGIFRIFKPKADPLPAETEETPSQAHAASVPLPRPRPTGAPPPALSARETLTLAAARH